MKVSPWDNQGSQGTKAGMSFEKESTNRNKIDCMFDNKPEVDDKNERRPKTKGQ